MKEKTTAEDFKLFKAEAEYWIEKFHLREWRFLFVHRDNPDVPNSCAWILRDPRGRITTIGLTVDWGEDGWEEISDFNVCKSAFHEICELMLADIIAIAEIDICPTDRADLETYGHALIRRMEWAVWEPDYRKRHGSVE